MFYNEGSADHTKDYNDYFHPRSGSIKKNEYRSWNEKPHHWYWKVFSFFRHSLSLPKSHYTCAKKRVTDYPVVHFCRTMKEASCCYNHEYGCRQARDNNSNKPKTCKKDARREIRYFNHETGFLLCRIFFEIKSKLI